MRRRTTRSPLIGYLLILGVLIIIIFGVVSNIRIQSESRIVEFGNDVNLKDVKVTMFGVKVKWPVSIEGEIDTSKVGEYEVYYKPLFTLNREKVVFSVVDTQKPKILLNGASEITLKDIEEYKEEGYIATDNYDGDITENVVSKLIKMANNQYLVEYSVMDSNQNSTVVNRIINIVKGRVCLTFDDGPSPNVTPKILELLKENDIKATFFLIGYDKSKSDIVRQIHEDGHTIGLHGYSHVYSEIYTSIDALMENFKKIQTLVEETTGGYSTKIIRFPGGASNTVSQNYCKGIMTEAVQVVEEHGYIFYDWNVDSGDAGSAKTSNEIYENVTSGIKPGRLNVVLMHDSGGHDETLEALEWIIRYCKENCYIFEAITPDTKPVIHHNVSN